ncbi:MAG: alanyl-tRNA editing protein [Proteobacteria bacterium]|nr:MAG: alanyl-tRNA editing protein [Pseudomonadota bacterium]
MSTEELFRENAYLKTCDATVTAVDGGRVFVDRTVFYPMGGGQPGDSGELMSADGATIRIVDARKDSETGEIAHIIEDGMAPPGVGERVTLAIDWSRRFRHMRLHSCMHMLCSLIPFGVTGGSISEDRARLDFDMQEPLDKEALTAQLNQVIAGDHPMRTRWITEEELDAKPDLVRTMSVQPPRGSGRIRLVNFEGVDLQPCGGTHVASTGEIGAVKVQKIEKKGKHNRRVIVVFDE